MRKWIQPDKSCNLSIGERDRSLLKDNHWPNVDGLEGHWTVAENKSHVFRTLGFVESRTARRSEDGAKSPGVREAIFRFPNAPVYHTHRARRHPYKIEDRWPNYHTMRVLTREDEPTEKEDPAPSRPRHVFLLHNGLNETKDIGFHYRLANWILATCEDAACIIRPLPAHLSRYPFQSPFAERPLDEFLLDPASLFRQFLRYMLETQWLLSVIVPRADYDVITGCELLLNGAEKGREDSSALAVEIATQANRALLASDEFEGHSKQPVKAEDILEAVVGLRAILGWEPIGPGGRPDAEAVESPAVHVVGYSMGGFVAQSVFCAWPFAVASCSNMFAGGALRDLAPTAFAHPEEWQSVLHGLRSELDQARVEGFFEADRDPEDGREYVVGIEREVFDYFDRIFVDVFLQADRGSYSTRLAEFSRRLLFILGGDDPIVRTRNVLDAAPPGGINLHQIGDMSHFPGNRRSVRAEKEQRDFWLPETVGMVTRFARRAADLLQQTNSRWWNDGADKGDAKTEIDGLSSVRLPDRGLSNMQFEHELDRTVEMIEGHDGGWLFIARNQIPTVFLGEDAFDQHAAAMHHSENLIGQYVESLARRADRLEEHQDRLTLLVPASKLDSRKGDWVNDRARFSKSEVAIRFYPDECASRDMWDHFLSKWARDGGLRFVSANEYRSEDLPDIGPAWSSKHKDSAGVIPLTMLPDVWIAFDRKACVELLGVQPELGRDVIEEKMVDLVCQLVGDPKIVPGVTNMARRLHDLRTVGSVRTIRVSTAELNPRYRGQLLDDPGEDVSHQIQDLLIYWAMTYRASTRYVYKAEAAPA